jgi:heme/copper-type cytochrome/quinol oxidase subunit 2
MLELWNYWYDILASVEALATVIVIVVLGAGVITLWQGRRRQTRPTKIDLGRRRQIGHLDQRRKKSVR